MSHYSFFFFLVAEHQVSQFYNKESHKNDTGIFMPLTLPKLPKSMCNNGNYAYTDTDRNTICRPQRFKGNSKTYEQNTPYLKCHCKD